MSAKYDSVLVQTGCIYGTAKFKGYGLPTYYFKVIKYNGITEAYLGENIMPKSTDYTTMKVDISIIQKLTKIKF